MSEKRELKIKLYNPTQPQLDALKIIREDKPQITCIAFGRQTGKTYMMWMEALTMAMNEKKKKVLWISPILDQALKVMKEIEDYFEDYKDIWAMLVARYDRKYNNLILTNGSIIRFRSADSGDNLRGMTNDHIFIDEAAYCKLEFIQEVLMPMLTRTQGRMTMASTFNGKNWYWDWFNKGQRKENWSSIKSIKRTYIDLKDEKVTETVSKIKATMSSVQFAQEYLCEPTSSTTVFSGVDLCTYTDMPNIKNKKVFIGMDLGISQDYTVLTAITEDYVVIDIDRFHYRNEGMDNSEYKARIINFVHKHKEWCVSGHFEGNQNELLYDELCEDPVFADKMDMVIVTPTSKPKMISNLVLLFDKKKIRIPDNVDLVFELFDFTAKKTESGNYKFGNNYGKHDDMVMSLAHSAWCVYDYMDGGTIESM